MIAYTTLACAAVLVTPRCSDLLLSPKRLIIVAQTSNFVSPKWTFGKKIVAQMTVHHVNTYSVLVKLTGQ